MEITPDTLRAQRKLLGLTQEELAHDLGVTTSTVNHWENGRRRPSRIARLLLAHYYADRLQPAA